jgi:serine/threonine protein kinase
MVDYTNTSLHFKLIQDIGEEGKNSTVHIAHDFQLDTNIAVKKIRKSDFTDSTTFFDEAKRLYSSHHQNIVPIQYSCQDADHIYVSMPLFMKGSLSKKIDMVFLTPTEIIKYSIDFLCGLHHIHTKKLVHGDIKPNNILISDSNDGILADFGLARSLKEDGTTEVEQFYHIHRAPETLLSNLINQQSDIFQAGLTIYRLCNGNNFFKKQVQKYLVGGKLDEGKFHQAIQTGKFPDRSFYLDHIPRRLRNYIRKALAPDPADRYNSVLDFLNDLAGIEITYDWRFSISTPGYNWVCLKDEKEYKIELKAIDGSRCSVKTTKRKIDGGSERNISQYTTAKIENAEAQKLVKEALHNNEL